MCVCVYLCVFVYKHILLQLYFLQINIFVKPVEGKTLTLRLPDSATVLELLKVRRLFTEENSINSLNSIQLVPNIQCIVAKVTATVVFQR